MIVARYNQYPIGIRLLLATSLAVIVNAAYCLLYTLYAGQPDTLGQAVMWGAINIAPWVAAVEISRSLSDNRAIALTLIAALLISLLVEAIAYGMPGEFGLVRRMPGLAISAICIGALRHFASRKTRKLAVVPSIEAMKQSEWIGAAGNYVEFHRAGVNGNIARATLANTHAKLGDTFIRIHRSFLVRRSAVVAISRDSVRLQSGKRLPLGAAYRAGLMND